MVGPYETKGALLEPEEEQQMAEFQGIAQNVNWNEERISGMGPFLLILPRDAQQLQLRLEQRNGTDMQHTLLSVYFYALRRKDFVQKGDLIQVTGHVDKHGAVAAQQLVNLSTGVRASSEQAGLGKYFSLLILPFLFAFASWVGFLDITSMLGFDRLGKWWVDPILGWQIGFFLAVGLWIFFAMIDTLRR